MSEILKWIAIILILLAIIFFAAGFAEIDDNTFTSLIIGVFGGTISFLGVILLLFFSPGMIVASIVLPIIGIVVFFVFNIIEKDTEANIKKLDWAGVAIAIAFIVITGIYFYQWTNFRQTSLIIGLVVSAISKTTGFQVGFIAFLLYDSIKPGIALFLVGLFLIIGSGVILLLSRIKQIDVLKS